MDALRISDLARRAGVPVTTVRYYERIGLIPEPERTASGYRIYDEAAEARLVFISRAKRFGLSLDEIHALAAIWDDTNCAATIEHLTGLLDAKQAEISEQILELERFSRQLGDVQDRLIAGDAPAECAADLACCTPDLDGAVDVFTARPHDVASTPRVPVACTLDADAHQERLAEFEMLAPHVTGWSRTGTRLQLTFPDDPDVADQVRDLSAKEARCCAFLSFEVLERTGRLEWIVRAPNADAGPTLDEFRTLLIPDLEKRDR